MLQILKRKDAKGYEDIVSKLNLSVFDVDISEAIEDNRVIGYIIYRIFDDNVCIYEAEISSDLEIYDGLIRSILFLASLRGIEKAIFLIEDLSRCVLLGFLSFGENKLEPISKILGGCCNCK